jgi:hypothetical protein
VAAGKQNARLHYRNRCNRGDRGMFLENQSSCVVDLSEVDVH